MRGATDAESGCRPQHNRPVERVLIAGCTGAGKTTLAKVLSRRLGLPRHELDALRHGPSWTPRPEFEADVEAFSATPRWVTEDQYHSVIGDRLWQRADTVIWLDLPRRTVMTRVVRRSVVRAVTREELWHGNRESWRSWLDPEHPIRWAWSQLEPKRALVVDYARRNPHVRVVRCTSPRDVRELVG